MQHISDSLPTTADPASASKRNTTSGNTASSELRGALAALWVEFDALWPGLWQQRHGEVGGEVFAAWLRTLAGLGAQQVSRGIQRVRESGRQYPPEAVEFRRLCAPEPGELGLPDVRSAYVAACNRDWRHPIIWHAVQALAERGMAQSDLHARPESETYPAFRQVYARLVQRADDGEQFTFPETRSPSLAHQPVDVPHEFADPAAAREAFRRFGRRARDGQ